MARVVVIGGSGHVGTYLVPRLVQAGHEVVNVTRGARKPYSPHSAWAGVETVVLDREGEERAGTFGAKIAALRADIVIDMICFTLESAKQIVDALKGRVAHFLHCGTIWVHGHAVAVPTTEAAPRRPFGEYGIQKAAIEAFLLDAARRDGFPATVVHPGHIVGPGWAPLNPAGHFNPAVFTRLARGEELTLPNFGLETVHHVHADDVAQAFMQAIANWSASAGESFHAVSPQAMTLRGYAEAMAVWFGREARLAFQPFEAWKTGVSVEEATATWEHIARSPSCSIAKAERLIGYRPRYTSLAAVE
ncbi:MAG TPA: NAD-dependent epimerase/dehydratase family protein, partial [Bauldia sp.]|nr:NAD-dependent epimerase/dehydratase family protein [Bauldia sp.]